MRSARDDRASKGKLTDDPERHQLVQLGIEWGRTARELSEAMTPDELVEVLAVYDDRAKALKRE
jgi:hypothetical protein